MIAKIQEILSSIRFWQAAIAVVLFTLVQSGVITGESAVTVAAIIYKLFGISVVIGTADSVAKKLGTAIRGR